MAILKYFITFILLVDISFADDLTLIKEKLIENITSVFVKSKEKKIFIHDSFFDDTKPLFNKPYKIVNSCEIADICFIDDIKDAKVINNKIVFITNYPSFLKDKNLTGAFFWQKGRPTLLIRENILKIKHIKIPKSYERFIY